MLSSASQKLTFKQRLAQLTSKQGLITGSVVGLATSIVSIYLLVPIFEKSEDNAIQIVEKTATLDSTTKAFDKTAQDLKKTSEALTISTQKVASLKTVEGELIAAQERIIELKNITAKDGSSIAELQEKVENKNTDIANLTTKAQTLNNTIAAKKRDLNDRKEWIGELKKKDDEIVENAMLLVDNFMKISDTSNSYGITSSASRDDLLVETLTLVNTLDTQRNKRKIFVDDLKIKLKE
jgi:chromosome segregation ATPase